MQISKLQVRRVEFDVAENCNLACCACSHCSPFYEETLASLETYRRHLAALGQFVHVGCLRLVGGEPLLHPRLPEFIRFAKTSGFADRVAVATNGILLGRQTDDFWNLADLVDVSLYGDLIEKFDERAFAEKAARHGTELRVQRKTQFRQTVMDYPNQDAALIRSIFRVCDMARHCHTIRNGRLYRCSISPFLDPYLRMLGYDTRFALDDGLPIEEHGDLVERVARYLKSEMPLGACLFCLGSCGKLAKQHQMSRSEITAPSKARKPQDLLDRPCLARRTMAWRLEHAARRLPRPLRLLGRPALLLVRRILLTRHPTLTVVMMWLIS